MEVFRSKLREELLAEAATHSADTALLSFEGLFHLDKASVKRLVGLLNELTDTLDVFCVVRRQDRYAVSSYSTRLVNNGCTTPSLLYHAAGNPVGQDSYRHLQIWKSVVGRQHMHVRAYEDYDNILSAYLDYLGLPADEFELSARENSSFSAESQEIMRLFNLRFAQRPEWSAIANDVRQGLRDILPKGAPRLPTEGDVRDFLKTYRRKNQKLISSYLKPDTRFDENTPLPETKTLPQIGDAELESWVRKAVAKKGHEWPCSADIPAV